MSSTGAFFSGWLLDHLILMVTRYLELGFELRLYAGFEYSMIFWCVIVYLGAGCHSFRDQLAAEGQLFRILR